VDVVLSVTKEIDMEQFIYDDGADYESNFSRWRIMNDKERSDHNEELYTEAEAKRVFDSMYGNQLVEAMKKLQEKFNGESD